MGRIKKLIETELVGGSSSTDIYPVTSTKAVYDTSNKDLDTILSEIDSRESSLENKTSELESNKLSKGDLAQSTGSSTTTAMSQNVVTKELGNIEDKVRTIDSNLFRNGSGGYLPWEANKEYFEGDVVTSDGQLIECMTGGSPASEEFNPDDWEATTVDQQSKKRDTSLGNRATRLEERCDKIEDTASELNNMVVQNKEEADARLKTLEEKQQVLTEEEYNALEDKDDNKFYYTYEEE